VNSFTAGFLESHPVPPQLIRTVRLLGEFKGKEQLFARQSPEVLRTLIDAAVYESTESSNRIEGVTAPPSRIRALVSQNVKPQGRSEEEIAGYRHVLGSIHANHAGMALSSNLVLQLHRDLFQFTPSGGGTWKNIDNEITARHADGRTSVRFKGVAAHLTPTSMAGLHRGLGDALDAGIVDPLFIVPAYVLDFLCVHPFRDGNGRMARLLSLLLLYKSGYHVGRYISLEAAVEATKEGYYDSLFRSSQGWHAGAQTLLPWWEYFLGVMLLTTYRTFEERVGVTSARRGAKRDMIIDAVRRLPRQFKYGDLERLLPAVSRPPIGRALRQLRDEKVIICLKPGRDATWEKRDTGTTSTPTTSHRH
jgi:Fic family protein